MAKRINCQPCLYVVMRWRWKTHVYISLKMILYLYTVPCGRKFIKFKRLPSKFLLSDFVLQFYSSLWTYLKPILYRDYLAL